MFHSIIQSTTAARVVGRHVMLNMTELLPLAICHVWDLWCFCSELSLTVFCRLLRQNCLCFVWPRSIKVRRPELATGHGLNNTCTTTNTSFCEAVCWYWIKGKAAFFFFFFDTFHNITQSGANLQHKAQPQKWPQGWINTSLVKSEQKNEHGELQKSSRCRVIIVLYSCCFHCVHPL